MRPEPGSTYPQARRSVATSRRKVMRRVSEEEISRFIKCLSLNGSWFEGRFSGVGAAKYGPEGQRLAQAFFLRNTG
jgi:hypothetical protein